MTETLGPESKEMLEKWDKLIGRLSTLIQAKGKEIIVFNIEAGEDIKRQFQNYQVACETVNNIYEAVVTTSFPGEERVFWPSQNVQFYIREGEDKIQATGNYDAFKLVFE